VSHHFNKSNIAIFTTKDSKDVVKLSISYYKYIGIRKICIVCPRDHHQELKFDFDNIEYIFDE
jgi:dTDP-glucose pyrophosphorylase